MSKPHIHASQFSCCMEGQAVHTRDTPKKLWKKLLSTTTACAAVGFALPASAREHGGCVEAVREVTLSLAPPCTRRATHIGQELEVPCKPPRAKRRRGRGSGGSG
eukprot:CAMPEP_0198200210 /NCGR_PEP_ID=MMETSP1445-20131203/3258_1 /TAXON_ID=36898 /ORGANISM="Pyramimonas sp., Strain CCMP2087" /LENGTH=104 /DNA_ID=CAMNT_0043870195 /DNA_START=187 /DNA_END=497 /DNA_ORIENTATION=+